MIKRANSNDPPPRPTRISRVAAWLRVYAAQLRQTPQHEALPEHPTPTPSPIETCRSTPATRAQYPRPALTWPELTACYPILHTDDELPLLELFNLLLVREKLTVLRTTFGHQALEICQHVPVSLVITDINKPDLSGTELLHRLQADPATADIPVMFLTAHPTLDAYAVRKLGVAGYYTKPLSPLDFVRAVYATLQAHGRWHTPPGIDPATSQRWIMRYRAPLPPE